MQKQSSKFGIYFHWPFCLKKCPYCDFNSYAASRIPHDRLTKAFLCEFDNAKVDLKSSNLESVYFGGGTPSLQKISNIAKILKHISRNYSLEDAEITIEVNPATADLEYLKELRQLGVNRLSIGTQSFNDEILKFLGRIHNVKRAREIIENARKAGFDNIGLDLILATAPSTMKILEHDLKEIKAISPEHVSAYILTIEPDTDFGRRSFMGESLVANEKLCEMQFVKCRELLGKYGFEHYEISNYAKKGYRSRHNQLYWDGSEYLGIGPGAHSYVKAKGRFGARYGNIIDPKIYIDQLNSGQSVQQFSETPGTKEVIMETIMTGLRRLDGISEDEFKKRTGKDFDVLNNEKIIQLSSKKMISLRKVGKRRVLRLTAKGVLFSDDVILELV